MENKLPIFLQIANIVSKEISKNSVVVFDEAHNIDNVCIETMSVSINQEVLQKSTGNLTKEVEKQKAKDEDALQQQFNDLVAGLQE